MNRLSKIGLSALCGSLASISTASAGEISVSGAAVMTWITNSGKDATTGHPTGMATNLTFSGSSELDWGQKVAYEVAHDDQAAWSSANMSLTTNHVGTFKVALGGGGGGIGGYDDNSPTAWEEVWGAGVSAGIDFQKGVGSSTYASWTSPKLAGSTLQIAYAPRNTGTQNNDKSTSGDTSSPFQRGLDVVLDLNVDNAFFLPNIFIGASQTEMDREGDGTGYGKDIQERKEDYKHEGVAGIKMKIGPVSAGGQASIEHLNNMNTGETEYYANSSWGVAFNINDDLSISYGEISAHKDTNGDVEPENIHGHSIQVAYTLGGASFKYARTEIDHRVYSKGANQDAQTIRMSLAF